MSKFKVGDRVRRVGYSEWPDLYGVVGNEYTVIAVGATGNPVVMPGGANADCRAFELVRANPIRTVTRREIVPGVYGEWSIAVEDGDLYVEYIGDEDAPDTAESLGEAAHLFNQLAEVLEENEAKAAA